MTALGIGLLGAARITEKAIVQPSKVVPKTRLAAIAARSKDRASDYAAAHGVEQVCDGYDQVIGSDAIDLIYNPLPINLHKDWTIRALEAGKHVLCEKPFAMNADEARAMQAAAEASGNRLIEAFHYRYHPAFQHCLDWLAEGEIGDLQEIRAAFNVGIKDNGTEIRHRVETGGGAMMDLGCYPLNWALMVMGEDPRAIEASATLTPVGVDDTMSAQLSFESGAIANLETSMAVGESFRADMRLIGSKGEIEFINPLAPHIGARLVLKRGTGAVFEHKVSPISTYTWQLAAVAQAIGDGDPLPTEGAVILRQQAALDGVYEAAGLRHLRYL